MQKETEIQGEQRNEADGRRKNWGREEPHDSLLVKRIRKGHRLPESKLMPDKTTHLRDPSTAHLAADLSILIINYLQIQEKM